MQIKKLFLTLLGLMVISTAVHAVKVTIVSGAVGNDIEILQGALDIWTKRTGNTAEIIPMPPSTTDQFGQYRLWLSAHNEDIDIYRMDVIWAPQIAEHLVDLSPHVKDVIGDHFESIVQSQTVNGKLVALPMFTDAPALYYRKDLLKKYNRPVPKTWNEMAATARIIQNKERAKGNKKMHGFVFQGAAYEGLTCDALEWIKSSGGGQIIEADGSISVNNPKAIAAIERVKGWVGKISPKGVLSYKEEDSRGVWQTGNAVFMRNWPYAYSLGNSGDSAVKGKFGVSPLPSAGSGNSSAATLGGWNLGVSKYSKNQDAAISLVKFLGGKEIQKRRALLASRLPTIKSLYKDGDIAKKQPIIPNWLNVFLNAVPRPSAPAKKSYNEVSKEFWTAVHSSISGEGTTQKNFKVLERKLKRLKGNGWK